MQDYTHYYYQDDIESSKVVSGLAYFGILFFLPMAVRPNSRFGRFHANQSLALMLVWALGLFAVAILRGISRSVFGSPGLAGFFNIIGILFYIGIGVLCIMGMIYAFRGRAVKLPFVGNIKLLRVE